MRPTPSPFTSADRAFRYTLAGLAGALLLVSTACEKEKAAPPAAPIVEFVTVSQRALRRGPVRGLVCCPVTTPVPLSINFMNLLS